MTKNELDELYAKKISDAMDGDPETDHKKADKLLCDLLRELGCIKTVSIFIDEADSFWYT